MAPVFRGDNLGNVVALKNENTGNDEREIYLRIFAHAKDSIYLIDPETSKIIFANPKASEDTSYEIDELEGLDFKDLFLEEEKGAIQTTLEACLQWNTGVDPHTSSKTQNRS